MKPYSLDILFRQLCERLTPFYRSSSRCYKTEILQSLLNCLEQHPDMELAVVARTTGLTECLKNEKIAASAKVVDATDAGNTDTSLLQAAKVYLWLGFNSGNQGCRKEVEIRGVCHRICQQHRIAFAPPPPSLMKIFICRPNCKFAHK